MYIIKNALSLDTQLHWAKISTEEYSQATHTNLTHLYKQSILSDKTSEEESSRLEDLKRLWEDSVKDNDGFKRFKPLRWASLGYHYDWTAR